eukprot:12457381-Alexandrium_andersonii.AAC.1
MSTPSAPPRSAAAMGTRGSFGGCKGPCDAAQADGPQGSAAAYWPASEAGGRGTSAFPAGCPWRRA